MKIEIIPATLQDYEELVSLWKITEGVKIRKDEDGQVQLRRFKKH